jgi:hypothetical protein
MQTVACLMCMQHYAQMLALCLLKPFASAYSVVLSHLNASHGLLLCMQAIGEIADSLAGPAAEFDAAEGDEAAAAAAAPVGLVAVPKKVVKSKELLEYLDRPEVSDAANYCCCCCCCCCGWDFCCLQLEVQHAVSRSCRCTRPQPRLACFWQLAVAASALRYPACWRSCCT